MMCKGIIASLKKLNEILNREQKRSLGCLFSLMLLSATVETFGISLIIPFLGLLTDPDRVLSGEIGAIINNIFMLSQTNQFLILFTVLLIFAFAVKYFTSYILAVKQTNFINRNRFAMAKQMMIYRIREEYEDHLYRNITEDIDLVTTYVTWTFELIRAFLSVSVNLLRVLVLSIFMLLIDTRITLIFSACITVLYLGFHWLLGGKLKRAGEEANKTWEEYDKTISESFILKKENDVFKRNDLIFNQFCYFGKSNIGADEKKVKYSSIPGLSISLIFVWAILFYVLFSLIRGKDIISNLGTLSAFYLAAVRIMPGMTAVYSCLQDFTFYTPSLERVYEVIKGVDDMPQTDTLNRRTRVMYSSIDLVDVSFCYKNAGKPVLEHIDLQIRCGERIGVFGKTGSGKTTLINLIIGLIRPQTGEIRVDDLPLEGREILDVGYVPQDTNLLDATIRENIVFGRQISDTDLSRAIEDAGLGDLIRKQPDGLDTEIGAQGMRLSGGQRQRIGIARALVGSPSVLIFDEATSSLDIHTEQEIIRTIKALQRDRTVILVSHRPNTLQYCDRWFSVENGTLKQESGVTVQQEMGHPEGETV